MKAQMKWSSRFRRGWNIRPSLLESLVEYSSSLLLLYFLFVLLKFVIKGKDGNKRRVSNYLYFTSLTACCWGLMPYGLMSWLTKGPVPRLPNEEAGKSSIMWQTFQLSSSAPPKGFIFDVSICLLRPLSRVYWETLSCCDFIPCTCRVRIPWFLVLCVVSFCQVFWVWGILFY